MKVISREPKENSAIDLVIEVDAATFDAAIQTVYRKSAARFNVPGFRKGKAPRKIIESMYGASIFYEDAINEAYPDAYDAAIAAENIAPVAHPDLEILSAGKEGFSFKATVTVRPPVTLGQYKGLTAQRDEVIVTDEDIAAELAPLIERATRIVTADRAAALGDTVILDFEGFDNGVAFDGGKGEGHSLELGSGSFIPGFEDGVVGMKAGDEKDIAVTFPTDYAPELAGKDVIFHVKAHEVKEKVAPVLDDEFAKDVSEFETLDALKKDTGDKLAVLRTQQADRAFEDALLAQVVENMTVELPDPMVRHQAEKVLEEYESSLKNRGMSLEQYMGYTGTTQAALMEQASGTARARLMRDLALEEIAAAEGLTVTEEDRAAEYASLAAQYSISEETVRKAIPEKSIDTDLCARKAVELIKSTAKVGKPEDKKAAKKADKAEGETKKTTKKAPPEEGDAAPKKAAAKKPAAKKAAPKAADKE